jgi:NAD-reducing hydrogenase large subunit
MHWAGAGGVSTPMDPAERDWMLAGLDEVIAGTQEGIAVAKAWLEANQEVVNTFANFPSSYLSMVQPDGALELFQGQIKLIDKSGA